jgi:hypothetical protein
LKIPATFLAITKTKQKYAKLGYEGKKAWRVVDLTYNNLETGLNQSFFYLLFFSFGSVMTNAH